MADRETVAVRQDTERQTGRTADRQTVAVGQDTERQTGRTADRETVAVRQDTERLTGRRASGRQTDRESNIADLPRGRTSTRCLS